MEKYLASICWSVGMKYPIRCISGPPCPFSLGESCLGCSARLFKVPTGNDEERDECEGEQGRIEFPNVVQESVEQGIPTVVQDQDDRCSARLFRVCIGNGEEGDECEGEQGRSELPNVVQEVMEEVTPMVGQDQDDSCSARLFRVCIGNGEEGDECEGDQGRSELPNVVREVMEEVTPMVGQDQDDRCSAGLFRVYVANGEEGDECEGEDEGEQGRIELPNIVQETMENVIPMAEQDQDDMRDVVGMTVAGVQEGVVCMAAIASGFVPVEAVPTPTMLSAAVLTATEANVVTTKATKAESATVDNVGEIYLSKEVGGGQKVAPGPMELRAENDSASVTSEASGVGPQTFSTFSLSSVHVDVDEYDCSPPNGLIIQRILGKYGDITRGSMLKSTAAKSVFLELVADAVNRLCNHTMETLSSHELRLIEMQTADSIAVGFNVEWLQRRVDEVIAASKYQSRQMELVELGLEIESAKKSLAEMEQQHMVLASEVATIKSRMEGRGIGGSSLCDGLL